MHTEPTWPVRTVGCRGCDTHPYRNFMSAHHQFCHFCGHIVLHFCIFGTKEEELGAAA